MFLLNLFFWRLFYGELYRFTAWICVHSCPFLNALYWLPLRFVYRECMIDYKKAYLDIEAINELELDLKKCFGQKSWMGKVVVDKKYNLLEDRY